MVPIRVSDAELWTTEHRTKVCRLDMQARFFPHLPHDGILRGFVRFDCTAYSAPIAFVRVPNQEQSTFVIEDQSGNARHEDERRSNLRSKLPEVVGDRHRAFYYEFEN